MVSVVFLTSFAGFAIKLVIYTVFIRFAQRTSALSPNIDFLMVDNVSNTAKMHHRILINETLPDDL